jgi:hypothetical protein
MPAELKELEISSLVARSAGAVLRAFNGYRAVDMMTPIESTLSVTPPLVLLAKYPDVDEDWSFRSRRPKRPPGQWMFPRASHLTSKRVRGYSDKELFWTSRTKSA